MTGFVTYCGAIGLGAVRLTQQKGNATVLLRCPFAITEEETEGVRERRSISTSSAPIVIRSMTCSTIRRFSGSENSGQRE